MTELIFGSSVISIPDIQPRLYLRESVIYLLPPDLCFPICEFSESNSIISYFGNRSKGLTVEYGTSASNNHFVRSSGRLRVAMTTAPFSDILQLCKYDSSVQVVTAMGRATNSFITAKYDAASVASRRRPDPGFLCKAERVRSPKTYQYLPVTCNRYRLLRSSLRLASAKSLRLKCSDTHIGTLGTLVVILRPEVNAVGGSRKSKKAGKKGR